MPYKVEADGAVWIMLITSRGTGRWIVPKGNRIRGLLPHQAAAREAFEEGGIIGKASSVPIGTFNYAKRMKNGATRAARVNVFPLAVEMQASEWPEQTQRRTAWFRLSEAAAAVAEPELKAIILNFQVPTAGREMEKSVALGRRFRVPRWLHNLLR